MKHMTKCRRCGKELVTDLWGKWITRDFGWRTCGGDRPHDLVGG